MAAVYDRGRALPTTVLAAWAEAVAPHLIPPTGVVADLGAGTGRFSQRLASRLGRPVIAIEPAPGMYRRCRHTNGIGVSVVAGRAEAIPLTPGSCALVWMSQVIHHVEDLDVCATELRRVCMIGGRVALRGMYDLGLQWPLATYFPEALPLAEALFPPLDHIIDAFGPAGLQPVDHQQITQRSVDTPQELLARTQLRADSLLARLSDHDYATGLARLTDAVDQERLTEPVTEQLDLVVFE